MIRILVRCDAADCSAEAVLTEDKDDQPVCSENYVTHTGLAAHCVIDTGWISVPAGWQFSDVAGPEVIFCPDHAPSL